MKKSAYLFLSLLILIGLSFYYFSNKQTVSVVIPIYNAEKYLERCLDSVVKQTGNIEIIAVNDGSYDNSLKILEKYAKKYSNIKIINQQNMGVAEARNNGIKVASSHYITFLDSDDWLEDNAIKSTFKIIKQDNPDVILTSYYDVYDKEWVRQVRGEKDAESINGMIKYQSHSLEKLSLFSPFFAKNALNDLYYVNGGVRGYFFKKEFLDKNNVNFTKSLKCYEDENFMVKVFSYNPKISILNDAIYNYFNRFDSISKSEKMLTCGRESWEFISQSSEYNKLNRIQKMLIKDAFVAYVFLGFANFKRHNIPLKPAFDEAQRVIESFSVFNKKELMSLRNYPRLHNILSTFDANQPL